MPFSPRVLRFMPAQLAFVLFLFIAFLGIALAGRAQAAQSPLEMSTEDERLVKWDLSADSLTNLSDSEVLEARGNVYLRRGNEYLKADFARYYLSTKWVYLKGNVDVRVGRDRIKAEEAEFDLRSRVGWLKKGQVFMEGPHTYLSGEHINKHWGDVYSFKKAKVTTCDGDVPAWSITADEAVVEIDGYARLTSSAFQVKDTPVAFSPYMLFPTKTTRQTGFLTPDVGISSSKGSYFNQPFFWAINDTSDMTFNEQFMDKRGFMHGIEYRTRPSVDSAGWIRFDWLHDNRIVNVLDSGPYDYDPYVRTNHDRFWLRGMYDTLLPDPNWRFKADLDYVSDQDFLSEFKNDFGGFSRSQNELFRFFNRKLQEKNLNRVSGLLLTRDWQRFSLALSSQYTQDPTFGHGNRPQEYDPTVQRLPQLDGFLHKGRIIPAVPLEIQASAQAGYYYRRNGTRGARYEVVPRLSVPVSTRYGTVIASAGLTQSLYDTENPSRSSNVINTGNSLVDDSRGPRQDNSSRTIPDYNIAAFTEFARVYSFEGAPLPLTNSTVGQGRWVGVRHSIQPRIEYINRPFEDQENNPYYDSGDRLLPRSELVYSITNILTRKRESVIMAKNDKGEMAPQHQTTYLDLIRLRLENSYDYREATRSDMREEYERRPFGDILAELDVGLNERTSIHSRTNWSTYRGAITRHQTYFNYTFLPSARAFFGYDYWGEIDEYKRRRDNKLNYLAVGGAVDVWGPWSIAATYKQDFQNADNKVGDFRLTYSDQCFKIIGRAVVEPQEKNFGLMFVLTGLGN